MTVLDLITWCFELLSTSLFSECEITYYCECQPKYIVFYADCSSDDRTAHCHIFVKTQEPELNFRLKVCLGVKYRKCRRGQGNQPSMDKTLVSLPLNIAKP